MDVAIAEGIEQFEVIGLDVVFGGKFHRCWGAGIVSAFPRSQYSSGQAGMNSRWLDGNNINRLAQGVRDFDDVAGFDALWIGDGINECGDVSSFEVVLGEVSTESFIARD